MELYLSAQWLLSFVFHTQNKTGTLKEKENELDAQIALLQSEVKEMHSTITGQVCLK